MRIAVGNDNSQLKQLWHFICMGNAMRLRAISAASERLKVSAFRAEFRQIGTSALGIQNAEAAADCGERIFAAFRFLSKIECGAFSAKCSTVRLLLCTHFSESV